MQQVAETKPLTRQEAIRILKAHEAEIRAQGVTRLALFGSTARDEARPDSDVDVLVDYDEGRRLSLLDIAGLQGMLADLLGRPVHLTERDQLKPYAKGNILRDAVEVFPAAEPRTKAAGTDAPGCHPHRQRLQDALDAIESIQGVAAMKDGTSQDHDMRRAAVEREMEIISDAVRRLPAELTGAYPTVDWHKLSEIGETLRIRYYDDAVRQAMQALVDHELPRLRCAIETMITMVDGTATKRS